jgi:hypothetical protein
MGPRRRAGGQRHRVQWYSRDSLPVRRRRNRQHQYHQHQHRQSARSHAAPRSSSSQLSPVLNTVSTSSNTRSEVRKNFTSLGRFSMGNKSYILKSQFSYQIEYVRSTGRILSPFENMQKLSCAPRAAALQPAASKLASLKPRASCRHSKLTENSRPASGRCRIRLTGNTGKSGGLGKP